MPFTIGGEWIPNKSANSNISHKPVKVRLVKRGKSILTVILNLAMDQNELIELLSSAKKKLGCGGTIKNGEIEIQGDKVELVKKILTGLKIKSQ